jgi:hypothetical protein
MKMLLSAEIGTAEGKIRDIDDEVPETKEEKLERDIACT